MRVLEAADLRWVAGGFCTCNEDENNDGSPRTDNDHLTDFNYSYDQVEDAREEWDTAYAAQEAAWETLSNQTPGTPQYTAAMYAYDAADAEEDTKATAFYYADAHWCPNGALSDGDNGV